MKLLHPILFLFIGILLFSSCENKSCENVVCSGYNQTCIDGVCGCIQGYEGANCDQLTVDKLQGSYQVSESCTTSYSGFVNQPPYSVSILPASTVDEFTINNFGNRGLPVNVAIVTATYYIIPEQNQGALQVSGGEGNLQVSNQIKFEYNYTISSNLHSCTAIFTKF